MSWADCSGDACSWPTWSPQVAPDRQHPIDSTSDGRRRMRCQVGVGSPRWHFSSPRNPVRRPLAVPAAVLRRGDWWRSVGGDDLPIQSSSTTASARRRCRPHPRRPAPPPRRARRSATVASRLPSVGEQRTLTIEACTSGDSSSMGVTAHDDLPGKPDDGEGGRRPGQRGPPGVESRGPGGCDPLGRHPGRRDLRPRRISSSVAGTTALRAPDDLTVTGSRPPDPGRCRARGWRRGSAGRLAGMQQSDLVAASWWYLT